MIRLEELSKTYRVAEKAPGLRASLRGLLRRQYRDVHAVQSLSFSIEPGERVGFLGPNGAGKTTTLKMLAGLLTPSSGRVEVLGFDPRGRPRELLRQITLVMGQKQQLLWDLPPIETLELNRAVYEIAPEQYKTNLGELTEMLELQRLLEKPTRQLSLGERMKCELAAALIHRPRVLFLDEPTIGLDVTMQAVVRKFIHDYNEQTGSTVLLTSHYMDDVAVLCPRVIVIDEGRLRHDGDLQKLVEKTNPDKLISVRVGRVIEESEISALEAQLGLTLAERQEDGFSVRCHPDRVTPSVQEVFSRFPVLDLTVEDPPLEETMRQIFANKR